METLRARTPPSAADEDIGDAAPAKIRKALALYQSVAGAENVEIRLHQTVLYNSIYRADDQLIVNQHAYGAFFILVVVAWSRFEPGAACCRRRWRSPW